MIENCRKLLIFCSAVLIISCTVAPDRYARVGFLKPNNEETVVVIKNILKTVALNNGFTDYSYESYIVGLVEPNASVSYLFYNRKYKVSILYDPIPGTSALVPYGNLVIGQRMPGKPESDFMKHLQSDLDTEFKKRLPQLKYKWEKGSAVPRMKGLGA